MRLAQDAYTKRLQDTLIDSLHSRINILEQEKVDIWNSFDAQLDAEREKDKAQVELITYEGSMAEFHKTEARKFRKQRNWLLIGGGVYVAYKIARVFVPP